MGLKWGEIYIYYTFIEKENGQDLGESALNFLDEEELQIYNRSHSLGRRIKFATGRALLKSKLAAQLSIAPEELHFSRNQYGKPYLKGQGYPNEMIDFNISHCKGLVACAFTIGTFVGIDVEEERRNILEIGNSFFSADEIDYIGTFPHEAQNTISCKIWTLKEAYVKAKGVGITVPLDNFSVCENNEFFFHSVSPSPGYYLSVAVERKGYCEFNCLQQEIAYSAIWS